MKIIVSLAVVKTEIVYIFQGLRVEKKHKVWEVESDSVVSWNGENIF
jgi:hypothetical protein